MFGPVAAARSFAMTAQALPSMHMPAYAAARVCCCRWESLPLPSKACVLTSLLHAICWLREVVAVFAPGVGADVLGATAGTTSQAT